jgi:hypothetical protein
MAFYSHVATLKYHQMLDIVDPRPEPNQVGSASFSRIRIQGMPIRIRPVQIGINSTFQACFFLLFPEKFNMLPKIKTTLSLIRKEKHCKLALLWIKHTHFPTCVKLGVESAFGSACFDAYLDRHLNTVDIRIRIGIITTQHCILHFFQFHVFFSLLF